MRMNVTEKKESNIDNIIETLKPNTYHKDSPLWGTLLKGLRRMTLEELSALWTLLTCIKK